MRRMGEIEERRKLDEFEKSNDDCRETDRIVQLKIEGIGQETQDSAIGRLMRKVGMNLIIEIDILLQLNNAIFTAMFR